MKSSMRKEIKMNGILQTIEPALEKPKKTIGDINAPGPISVKSRGLLAMGGWSLSINI